MCTERKATNMAKRERGRATEDGAGQGLKMAAKQAALGTEGLRIANFRMSRNQETKC